MSKVPRPPTVSNRASMTVSAPPGTYPKLLKELCANTTLPRFRPRPRSPLTMSVLSTSGSFRDTLRCIAFTNHSARQLSSVILGSPTVHRKRRRTPLPERPYIRPRVTRRRVMARVSIWATALAWPSRSLDPQPRSGTNRVSTIRESGRLRPTSHRLGTAYGAEPTANRNARSI